MSREEAQQAKSKLENMGYYPELVDDGSGYKVLVYSYGSSAVAKSTQQKLARAGLKPVEVKAENKQATLDQLRVGRYATRAEAEKARQQLSRSGFKGAEIVME
jgi:cell division protein FtsN